MPRFSSQPAAASIRLGDSQVLACDVNPDLVPLARWEREREPLELSSRLVQLPNGALVVSNARRPTLGSTAAWWRTLGPPRPVKRPSSQYCQKPERRENWSSW
uniref:neogenin-like n=1 Tax=Oncorhynchus gorbuscha TaxID=8017 RepID=UPI001EAF7FA7|nr:neogenin-like [Oncorhynchus gorbuscha]